MEKKEKVKGFNIYKRKDNRFEGRCKCGYKENGKPKYRSVYGKNYGEVLEKLIEIKKQQTVTPTKADISFKEAVELWLAHIRIKVKPSTVATYVIKLEKHILPAFSRLSYDDLTVEKLNQFISQKLSANLSAKYVTDIVILIKSIAKYLSRTYHFANWTENATLPKTEQKVEKKLLNEQEQRVLYNVLSESTSFAEFGILLASVTGIRIGELCGLKWSDMDFEKSTLTVSRTVQRIRNLSADSGNATTKVIVGAPKSASSKREIPLPDFLIPLLKKQKTVAETEFLARDKVTKGSSFSNIYIFTGTSMPMEPRTMQYRFTALLKRLKLPHVNFHALRHMFATECIRAGCDVKTLSEILGHSDVKITLNTYVHSSLESKKECIRLLSNRFCAA